MSYRSEICCLYYFYVEHAQPELRLRILYTKISLTWSLELGGML